MISFLITLCAFVSMEFMAWFTHKFVMHGFLWIIHVDHHDKRNENSWFERNDLFFFIFAFPSIILFLIGVDGGLSYHFFIGLGILLYGIAYFTVHDIFIHRRFKVLRNTKSAYFLALRKAHKAHHKKLGRHDGECFGMLIVPWKYYREARHTLRQKNGHGA
jgi:beta-carotene 3-hydroxylase